ncbi:hypothetical protein CCP3SC1AL1_940011 [Gammaproteobacteria bacterium]
MEYLIGITSIFLLTSVLASEPSSSPKQKNQEISEPKIENFDFSKQRIWEIPGRPITWVLIREKKDDIFHIEVIFRGKSKPSWNIKRLRPHLAITPLALQKSVIRPLPEGDVYPESFDSGYAAWKALIGEKPVCQTTVMNCIKN